MLWMLQFKKPKNFVKHYLLFLHTCSFRLFCLKIGGWTGQSPTAAQLHLKAPRLVLLQFPLCSRRVGVLNHTALKSCSSMSVCELDMDNVWAFTPSRYRPSDREQNLNHLRGQQENKLWLSVSFVFMLKQAAVHIRRFRSLMSLTLTFKSQNNVRFCANRVDTFPVCSIFRMYFKLKMQF